MAEFSLRIKLGNAEMSTGDNVAAALEAVAQRLADMYKYDEIGGWNGLSGGITDVNGNRVGRWEVRR